MLEKKTGKTPFHTVLELDEKVADNYAKLELLKYLSDNGAPTDSPDSSNIRPIHLAAQLQDPDIINFMVDKLDLDPSSTDFANNSALHWAVRGAEISCPSIPVTPGSLVPAQPIDKRSDLSVGYGDATKEIMNLLSSGPNKDDVVHIINTIMKLPEMYTNTKEERDIQTELVKIFTNVGIDPNYTGGLDKQQIDIDQLVDKTVTNMENTISIATEELVIEANNKGWGPKLPTTAASNPAIETD